MCSVEEGRTTVLLLKVTEILGGGGGATPSRGAGNGMRRPKQVKFALAPDVGQARNPPRGLLGRVRAGSGSAPSHEGRKTSPWFLGVKAQAMA